jgi:hypothetical protein
LRTDRFNCRPIVPIQGLQNKPPRFLGGAAYFILKQLFMKKAILSTALFLACLSVFGQGDSTNFTITFTSGKGVDIIEATTSTTGTGVITITGAAYDCVPFTRYTAWNVGFEGDTLCEHDWVYANEEDVNEERNYTTLEYCQCGCTSSTNEARLCEKCYRGEVRVRFDGWDVVVKEESAYSKLHKKAQKKH